MIMQLRKMTISFSKYEMYYHVLISGLAIGVVISLILELQAPLSSSELSVIADFNTTVWIIFIVDYLIRFLVSDNRIYFVKHNMIDLVAILPFNFAFQGLRSARVIKLICMLRCFTYFVRAYNQIGQILKTNNFHHVLCFTLCTIFLGAISISYIEDMEIGDALWWSFVTTTTVGYGDIAPQSFGGRIIAVFLMIIGIGFLSTLTGTISTFFMSIKKNDYKDEEIDHIVEKLNNFRDLSIGDLNNIHSVLIALKESETTNKLT